MGIVYKLENKITGELYVGQTKKSLEERFYIHKRRAKYGKAGTNQKLYEAMRKYGIENFEISELEQVDDDMLCEKEKYWIKELDTFNNGYNETLGGAGGLLINYDKIIALWKSGLSIGDIINETGYSTTAVEYILKGESSYNTSEANRRGARDKFRPVYQYDMDGNFLNKFESVANAAKSCNSFSQNICAACIENRTCKGYQWRYEKIDKIAPYKDSKLVSVEKYELDGTYIGTYDSAKSAAQSVGCSSSAILKCCSKKLKSAFGYQWIYEGDTPPGAYCLKKKLTK